MEQIDSSSDLDSLLSEYKDNFTENENIEQIESANSEPNGEVHTEAGENKSVDANVWRNNPLYYQTGKKAGQLRKLAKKDTDTPAEMEISGSLIDGAMFIMLIDLLFPLAITFFNNKVSDVKINADDLQLSEKQKKDLTPIADNVVKQLTIKADPAWLLFIAMTGMYGFNFLSAKTLAETKMK
jgi:hypothetical protein